MATTTNIPAMRGATPKKDNPLKRLRPLLFVGLFGASAFGIDAGANYYTAQRFGNNPAYLGAKQGKLYPPMSWFNWQLRLGAYDKPFFYYLDWCVVGGLMGAAFICSGGAFLMVGRRRAKPLEGLHGTAKFCETLDEVKDTGLLLPDAAATNSVMVGGWTDKDGVLRYLRHEGPEHVMAVAPTRSGKGVGLIVPTLLSWGQSCVVHDIKGELWEMTSGWRKKYANNIVLKFDPAAAEGSCSYNVLSEIRLGTPYEVGDVQNLVTIIVDPDGKGIEGDHFVGSAHALLVGLVLYSLHKAKEDKKPVPSLFDVGWHMSNPDQKDKELWEAMLKYKVPGTDTVNPVIAQTARDILSLFEKGEEEYSSVLSTTKRFLNIYRDPIIQMNTGRSDFKVLDLVRSEKPVSLYLVIRPADKDRLRPIVRLLVNQIMRVLTRDPLKFDQHNRPLKAHPHRILMMMDEFPAFRKLEIFEENMAFVAGYGIKCYVVCQDFNQLWNEYGENEAITSNCHVRVVYAPNRQETAEKISEMTGTMTVNAETVSEHGKQFGMTDSINRSYENVQRPLMTPHEISTMKAPRKNEKGLIEEAGEMLVFVAGHNPIYGTQPLYFRDPAFSERSMVKPPKVSDVIQQDDAPQTTRAPSSFKAVS